MPIEQLEGGADTSAQRHAQAAGQDPTTEIIEVIREQGRLIDELRRAVEESGISARSTSSPSQIVGDLDDYDVGAVDAARLDTDAARNITGFSGGRGGRYLLVWNVGSFNITLKHQDAGSSAENQIEGIASADVVLTPTQAAQLWYDATVTNWRIAWKT